MRDEHKSKEQLINELRMMRRLVEYSPDAVFIQSERKLVYANDAGAQLLGAERAEEVIGQQIIDVVSPRRWQNVQELIDDFLEEKKVPRIEKKFIRLDGSAVDVEVAAIPFTYEGKPAMQLVAQDISRRKKAEEALQESERCFREILENIQLVAVMVDNKGKILFCNDFMLQLTGWERKDILGKDWFEVFIPEDNRDNLRSTFSQLMGQKENRSFYHPEYIETRNGEKRLIALNSTLFFDMNGRVTGLTCIGEDITERKKAEKALRESEERYRDLFENANDLIQSVDATGKFQYVNRSWLKALGYTELEVRNLTFSEVIHPECLDNCLQSFQKVMMGESLIGVEATFLTKEGRMIEVEGNVTPRWENGKVVAALGILRDITERKRAREELVEKDRRIQRELQLANTIQSSLFPVNLPQVPGATLAATAVPANEVGGDYCDLFIINDTNLGIAIGDVMGKGVPAALFVAMTYAFVRNYAMHSDSASSVVNRVNRSLFPQLEFAEQFITFFYGIYYPETRELRYTNAGHNPPIVYRADTGECEYLPVRDFFLGGRQDAEYREGRIVLNEGDIVLFYTDGLKEGQNSLKEQFGMERIKRLLKESAIYDPASIQELISYEFNDFLAGEPPYDDVTMMVIKVDKQ